MSRKSYTPEQIIGMLREAEVALIAWQQMSAYMRRLLSRWF